MAVDSGRANGCFLTEPYLRSSTQHHMTATNPPELSGKVVLLVDDNDDHLDLLVALFERLGARVLMARNVDIALVYLENARVDLLVSDLAMPVRDGLALIRALRDSDGPQRTIPAIAVTGFPEEYVNARIHGFDAFLQKPIDPQRLLRLIEQFFGTPRG